MTVLTHQIQWRNVSQLRWYSLGLLHTIRYLEAVRNRVTLQYMVLLLSICQLGFDQAFVCWQRVIVVESYDSFWNFLLDRNNTHRLELASPVNFLKLNLTARVIILSDYLDVDWEYLQILCTTVGIRLEVWGTVGFLVMQVLDCTLLLGNIWRLFPAATDQDSVGGVWGESLFGPLRVALRVAVTSLAVQKVRDCVVCLL